MRIVDADKLLGLFVESGQKNGMKHGCKLGEKWLLDYNDIKAVIDDAPTVEERPKGEWVEDKTAEYGWSCFVCGRSHWASKYCPYCGADMRKD